MKTLAAALISVLLFSAIAGALLVDSAAANFEIPPPPAPIVSISSPEDKVYDTNSVLLTFSVNLPSVWNPYNLPKMDLLPMLSIQYGVDERWRELAVDGDARTFSVALTGLSDGRRKIGVRVTAVWSRVYPPAFDYPAVGFSEVSFTVDATPPRITSLSLPVKTYGRADDVPLSFTVSEQVSWVGYSLDGKATVTITDSTVITMGSFGRYDCHVTLTGLSEGSHSLTVQVKDNAGNTGESEAIQFTVAEEAQQQEAAPHESEPFPTATVAASTSVAALILVSLAVYYTKVRRNNRKPKTSGTSPA